MEDTINKYVKFHTAKRGEYRATVEDIRQKSFRMNVPFLFLSEDLPEGQAYWEYPDGTIKIRQSVPGNQRAYKIIKILSKSDSDAIRRQYGL